MIAPVDVVDTGTDHRVRLSQRPGTEAVAVFTGVATGDLRPDAPGGAARWAQVAAAPVTWLRQVHGARVVTVEEPGERAGEAADAAVTSRSGAALAVVVADCAPIALLGLDGPVGAVHAGWRGLVAGVVEAAVEELRRLGSGEVVAVIGPCIRPECYEFGPGPLDEVAGRFGPGVRGRTAAGAPALDVPAAATAALLQAGVAADAIVDVGVCTACSPRHWSHRAAASPERQALVVWRGGGSGHR